MCAFEIKKTLYLPQCSTTIQMRDNWILREALKKSFFSVLISHSPFLMRNPHQFNHTWDPF
jgi:hypothetical protein